MTNLNTNVRKMHLNHYLGTQTNVSSFITALIMKLKNIKKAHNDLYVTIHISSYNNSFDEKVLQFETRKNENYQVLIGRLQSIFQYSYVDIFNIRVIWNYNYSNEEQFFKVINKKIQNMY